MDLSFLNHVNVTDKRGFLEPVHKNPTGVSLRIFRTGEVYPSEQLVKNFDLEYRAKGQHQGNGLDFFISTDWEFLKQYPAFLAMVVVPRSTKKVQVFQYCRYADNGTPKSSVMTQGVKSQTLLDMVNKLGFFDDPDKQYVDLVVQQAYKIESENGLYWLPRTITKGPTKGDIVYERRENVSIYPVLPNTPKTDEVAVKPTLNQQLVID